MEEEPTQPSTQQVLDPRRLGESISGLKNSNIADILCILTPTSPAAFHIVENTAKEAPQHVLQCQPINGYQPNTQPLSQSLEEAETFILDRPPHDLALRFSSSCKQPWYGFCFGRNRTMCDVFLPVGPDSAKRISNLHFMIYVNKHGVLMLEDGSTNGTLVDDVHLKSKGRGQKTKMIQSGSMITLLCPTDEEIIKFIVRLPDMTGFEEEYAENLGNYMARVEAERLANGKPRRAQNAGAVARRPAVKAVNTFGMHWNGGRKYNVIDILGKGAFATVYKIAHAEDGQLLAAKELEKKRFMKNGHLDQKLDNEMKIMQSLTHPNIVQYIDTHDVGNHLYIIMEYVPYGNLSDLLSGGRAIAEYFVQRMACQILSCLAYLHSKRITHRDIKPDNILIASEEPFNVKLSDFGLSKVVTNNDTFLKTFCGTLLYCAPEVFPHYDSHGNRKRRKPGETKKKFHSYSQSVDIWSFGAVLWSSLCGSPPFEGIMDNTGRAMFDRIMETSLDPTPLREAEVSEPAIDLLTTMLRTDPAQRPTDLECLQHPWLASLAQELVPEILQPNLNDIPEEDEEDDEGAADAAENQFSQLSINDRKAGWGLSSQFYEDDEENGEEPEPEPINPHQSKRPRVRRDLQLPRYQPRNMSQFESSPEESQNPAVRTSNGVNLSMVKLAAQGAGHLFGEIDQTALDKPRTLDDETKQEVGMGDDSSEPEMPDKSPKANQSIKRRSKTPVESQSTPRKDPRGNKSAASLDGAESIFKGLTMDDQFEPHTPTGSIPETPSPSDVSKHGLNGSITHGSQEQTPRPTKNKTFNRQIKLSPPVSLWYDPHDPSTHNLEYATKMSGIDFASARNAPVTEHSSLPSTHFPSDASEQDADEEDNDDNDDVEDAMGGAVHSPPAADSTFRVPSPLLGKLTTTDDSIFKDVLRLQKQVESWGRNPDNTIVYPNENDTKIPKNAFTIWFYSPVPDGLARESKDWTKASNLKVAVHTNSRWGISVNGTRIDPPKPDGSYSWGNLYTGDIITVFEVGRKKLKFVCEFSTGEAVQRRPEGLGFQVFHTQPLKPLR
ncbi:putative meiosis-specific serine threonine-protein kinase mek1 [Diplodia seriata]|uniref:non-specific serine/threonine protein kinase n=1 Tax=Diplodia seriata TaxID=420778 RepID=A0A0G2E1N6_9PEZI|nr:putative meiosis-specific serine threonine-protein kinase mek1 [Diplodia seriata]